MPLEKVSSGRFEGFSLQKEPMGQHTQGGIGTTEVFGVRPLRRGCLKLRVYLKGEENAPGVKTGQDDRVTHAVPARSSQALAENGLFQHIGGGIGNCGRLFFRFR